MKYKTTPFTEPEWEEKEARRITGLPFFKDHVTPSRNQCKRQVSLLTTKLTTAFPEEITPHEAWVKAHAVVARAIELHFDAMKERQRSTQ